MDDNEKGDIVPHVSYDPAYTHGKVICRKQGALQTMLKCQRGDKPGFTLYSKAFCRVQSHEF